MISIIIPAFNEEQHIRPTIRRLLKSRDADAIREIIVGDGGSTDGTVKEAEAAGAKVIRCHSKGRAVQMNEAAAPAKAPVLYFLHADSVPPDDFIGSMREYLEKGYDSGCFRLRFDHPHWFLGSIAWFTRFRTSLIRFGDQSLFIKRELFQAIGGFDDRHLVMEDHEIVRRIKRQGRFAVIPHPVTTSARKFLDNGPYRLITLFIYIYLLYYLGYPQEVLVQTYRKRIRNGKL